ncbi:type II secretion system F family protein [Pseudidiomarina sp. CB1]|uniref:type II secretion system F family protein n=1 Tax=Pseudidiomarina sp. CB1 TaxID=2972484 RepID=UPI002162708D|nr:type II secretion system F family protein [Pseudidiomarina sp. CB1]
MRVDEWLVVLFVTATALLALGLATWGGIAIYRDARQQIEQHAEASLAVFLIFLPMRQFWYGVLLLTSLIALITLLLTHDWRSMMLTMVVSVGALPLLRNVLHQKRTAQIEQQLPEALRLLANSLHAGMGLASALALTAQQVSAPLATELSLIVQRQRTGETLESAFADFQRRAATSIVQFFGFIIVTSVRHGGQQADVLSRMAEAIQQQHYAQQRILSLSAQARLQGRVMFFLPLGLFFALKTVHQDATTLLLTTSAGQIVVVVCVCLMAAGYFLTRRILGQFYVAD